MTIVGSSASWGFPHYISTLHLEGRICIDGCILNSHWGRFSCIWTIHLKGRIYIDGCILIYHWGIFSPHLGYSFHWKDLNQWRLFIFGEIRFPPIVKLACCGQITYLVILSHNFLFPWHTIRASSSMPNDFLGLFSMVPVHSMPL